MNSCEGENLPAFALVIQRLYHIARQMTLAADIMPCRYSCEGRKQLVIALVLLKGLFTNRPLDNRMLLMVWYLCCAVVNIKAGGRSRKSGMAHSVILFAIVLGLGRLAGHIPLACLGGLLMKSGWDVLDLPYLARVKQLPKESIFVMVGAN